LRNYDDLENRSTVMKTVLLIDDDAAYCGSFCREATRRGYQADCELDAVNGLARVTADYPDVLVVDWQLSMGDQPSDLRLRDGILVARDARSARPSLPVIILTSWDQEEVQKVNEEKFHSLSKDASYDEVFTLIGRIA
jgi:ActR/RegA family two-component response regulator